MFRYPGPMRDPEDPELVPPVDRPPSPPPGLLRRLGSVGGVLLTAVGVLVVLPVLALAGAYLLGDVLNPPCTDEEREVWASIDHYADLQPQGVPGVSGCLAQFEPTEESPERILNRYRSRLIAEGWRQSVESETAGTIRPMPSGTPPPPEEMPYDYHSISLERDDFTATVSWEEAWVEGGDRGTVTTVMVNVYRN